MGEPRTVLDKMWLKNEIGDAVYQYFDPIGAFLRYLFGPRRYRVKFNYDVGMSTAFGDKTFTARNDREARRKAKNIAGENSTILSLELYRVIKVS